MNIRSQRVRRWLIATALLATATAAPGNAGAQSAGPIVLVQAPAAGSVTVEEKGRQRPPREGKDGKGGQGNAGDGGSAPAGGAQRAAQPPAAGAPTQSQSQPPSQPRSQPQAQPKAAASPSPPVAPRIINAQPLQPAQSGPAQAAPTPSAPPPAATGEGGTRQRVVAPATPDPSLSQQDRGGGQRSRQQPAVAAPSSTVPPPAAAAAAPPQPAPGASAATQPSTTAPVSGTTTDPPAVRGPRPRQQQVITVPQTPPAAGAPPTSAGAPPAGTVGQQPGRGQARTIPPQGDVVRPQWSGGERGPSGPPPGYAPGPGWRDRTYGSVRQVEPAGRRQVYRLDDRLIVRRDDTIRLRRASGATVIQLSNGTMRTVARRPAGDVVTVTTPDGRILHSYRALPGGRSYTLVDNRRHWRPGQREGFFARPVLLGALTVTIPARRYIVDLDGANEDDIYETLAAPPLERFPRRYSLEEILLSPDVRDRMRRIDLTAINFETGAWEVDGSEFPKLGRIASAMSRMLDREPDEVFLIEGHTDQVGDPEYNLELSDRRAEAVAQVLSDVFSIPPEALVTQGYGEQYPKYDSQGPTRVNRRVTVRRITPLLEREEYR